MFKKLLIAGLAMLGAIALVCHFAWREFETYLQQPATTLSQPIELLVEPGSSLTRVVNQLAQRGILEHPQLLLLYLKLTGQVALQAGEYQIPAGLSPQQILDRLAQGEVKHYQVTLLEGWTADQALEQLGQQAELEHTLQDDAALAKLFAQLDSKKRYSSPEGLFFPDTYRYVKGMSDAALLTTAYNKMQQVLDSEWALREPKLPFASPYEALILASIVERETAVDSEREQIAGVFIERLARGMRLQTDPTVIYALGDAYDGNIRRRDLQVESPYNTYRVKGLPPTPIALASRRSIEAVLHPLNNGKIYFVAKGDGSHYFSSTLEEHNKAVQEYQVRNRARQYRSTPSKLAAKQGDDDSS